jgi:hypothetical protein
MTDVQRYIVIETAISIVINTLISIAFVFLVFGRADHVASWALILDALPQSFMIALMSTFVPTLLTRKRLSAGKIPGLPGSLPRWAASLPVRAIAAAAAFAALGVLANAVLIALAAPEALPFSTVVVLKACYGAVLALIVTPIMLRLALQETIVR